MLTLSKDKPQLNLKIMERANRYRPMYKEK